MSGIRKPPVGAQLNLDHPLSHGLVACYLLNESDGKNVHDYSGQNNEGTISGMNDPPIATSGWNAGPHGGALAFDGVDDTVNLGSNKILEMGTGAITVLMRITPKDFAANYALFFGGAMGGAKGYGVQLSAGTGKITYEIYGQFGGRQNFNVAGSEQTIGIESHVCAVFDGILNNMRLYVNGIEKHNIGIADPGNVPSGTFYIGSYDGSIWYYKGSFSDNSIYNRALSAEEIAYSSAFPYCMFDDGTDWRSRLVPYIPVRDLDQIIAAETVRSVNSGRDRGATAATRVRGV